jgi:hypothetical protein
MSIEPVSPDPELDAIEASLGSLVPVRSRIDRDRVMFRAGQASARPSTWGPRAWKVIAATLALVAGGEAALLASRSSERIVEKVVGVREPAGATDLLKAVQNSAPDPFDEREMLPAGAVLSSEPSVTQASAPRPNRGAASLGDSAYERLTWQVLRYGLDGLPASSPIAPSASAHVRPWPAFSGRLLRDELRRALDPGDPS